MLEGYQGVVLSYDEYGKEVVKTVPYKIANSNLGLVVTVPVETVLDPVNKMIRTVAPISALGILGLMIIGFVIVRMIARPLINLTGVANKLSSGDLNVTLPELKSKDEVYHLNESLKGVLAAVAFLTDEVNSKEKKK